MSDPQVEPDAVDNRRVVLGGLAGELVYSDTDFAGVDPEIQAMFSIDDASAT